MNKTLRIFFIAVMIITVGSIRADSTPNAPVESPVDTTTCGVVPGKSLIVFVGRRISVESVPPKVDEIPFDKQFHAKYKILLLLCGSYSAAEIEFEVFDHYGKPYFAEFETVLLFVSMHEGRFYHQKYQFSDVYETQDGGWAGCGDPYQSDDYHRKAIRAHPIRFKNEVSFPLTNLDEKEIQEKYPADYFTRKRDRVICRAGATAAELFTVKREGVLKARGLYK